LALKRAVYQFGQEENIEDSTGVLERKKTAGTEWSGGGPRTTVTLAMCPAILQGVGERFHDLVRQKASSLFILLGRSSISIASLMMLSMYLGLMERMVVF
jgi:hypothetical protein